MRVVAIVSAYNEARFIGGCIEHLAAQGVAVHLIDNESTDRTVAIAERHLGRGLISIETLPRSGRFSLVGILGRKEQLAMTLDADWFIHQDADEIRVAPRSGQTLADALGDVDMAGYNAVNFREFTFVPTQEAPDHDHGRFRDTMRHYYPFLPEHPHRLQAWKRQPEPVDLRGSAGHRVRFPGLRMWPEDFRMRHYLFLSRTHAIEKYGGRLRTDGEAKRGWGGWRNDLARDLEQRHADALALPRQSELRRYVGDDALDPSDPLTAHPWNERWATHIAARAKGREQPAERDSRPAPSPK